MPLPQSIFDSVVYTQLCPSSFSPRIPGASVSSRTDLLELGGQLPFSLVLCPVLTLLAAPLAPSKGPGALGWDMGVKMVQRTGVRAWGIFRQ